MQSVLRKWGNSVGARIPLTLLKSIGLNVDDTVDIEARDNQIIIKAGTQETLGDMLAMSPKGSFDLNDEDRQWLNDKPVGREEI